jgi:hypothetical protein
VLARDEPADLADALRRALLLGHVAGRHLPEPRQADLHQEVDVRREQGHLGSVTRGRAIALARALGAGVELDVGAFLGAPVLLGRALLRLVELDQPGLGLTGHRCDCWCGGARGDGGRPTDHGRDDCRAYQQTCRPPRDEDGQHLLSHLRRCYRMKKGSAAGRVTGRNRRSAGH